MRKHNLTQSDRIAVRRHALSFCLAAVFVLVTFLLLYPAYLNNDDTNISYALAGYRTGTPHPSHPFVHVALARLIAALYTCLPTVAWWAVLQVVLLALSLWVLFDCILNTFDRAGIPVWVGALACTLVYWVFLLFAYVRVTFTLTSGLAGAAAMALLLCADTKNRRETVRAYLGAGCLFVLCYLIRNSAGNSMLCFVGAAVFNRLLNAKGKGRLREMLSGIGLVAIALVMTVTFRIGVVTANADGFAAFDTARGHFVDYPHVRYADDPALFASLGWDESIDTLANRMCFLDDAITPEMLEAVASVRSGGDVQSVGKLLHDLEMYFRQSGMSQVLVVASVILLLASIVVFCIGRNGFADLLTGCFVAMGTVGLVCYLLWSGRLPVRVFHLLAFPTVLFELILAVRLIGLNRTEMKRAAMRVCASILVLAVIIVTAWGGRIMANEVLFNVNERKAEDASVRACETYVIEHPENIYFIGAAYFNCRDLFHTYPDASARPTNLIDWGGTCWLSGWKTEQHARCGLPDAPTAEVFRLENVYFISDEKNASDSTFTVLYRYLTAQYGTVAVETVDTMPNDYTVYRFVF